MRRWGNGNQVADLSFAFVAAEPLQGAGLLGGDREGDRAAVADDLAGRPVLTVAGEADRARALAIERRDQGLTKAWRAQRQLEGGEVLQREPPAPGRQPQGLSGALAGLQGRVGSPASLCAADRRPEQRRAPGVGEQDADLGSCAGGDAAASVPSSSTWRSS